MSKLPASVYQDEKIKTTLMMLEQGKTREEIAAHFEHAVSGLNMYFYRKGFHWNGQTYVPKENEGNTAVDEAKLLTTKAGQIVRQLSQKQVNIKQVVTKNGFSSVEEMGEYMKGQGYVWNQEINNYEYNESIKQKQPTEEAGGDPSASSTAQPEGIEEYRALLAYLLDKKDRLFSLLETESDGTLPRYKFKGTKSSKTLGLPTSLQTLLNDFSKEFNVTQRDIVEVALAEFFKKYGYEEQLNSMLQV